MAGDGDARNVVAHYAQGDLTAALRAALQAAGLGDAKLTSADLAGVDQFHIGGVDATHALAQRAGLAAGTRVLDVGGGIGGPGRLLAECYGCTVEVLDLTEEFCRAGAMLTERAGLAERVTFRCASALSMPYPDASFNVAWTQHSSMNLADKARLYAEIHRVIRPGGRLALHEIMAGGGEEVIFPVPWARDGSISFLGEPENMRRLIRASGFRELAWSDETAGGLAWFERRLATMDAASAPPQLGLHLILGPDARAMFQNLVRNLREQRIAVVQAVFERV